MNVPYSLPVMSEADSGRLKGRETYLLLAVGKAAPVDNE
jgi:hypothetical protein